MPRSKPKPLSRSFYAAGSVDLAPQLLNKVFSHNGVTGRIVEVEAYDGANDAASHAYRGETPRNSVMFGPPGHLYVYFTYGMHFCANVVCGTDGVASAVLLRALAPLEGIEEMRSRRRSADLHLTSGPAKLCQALGIERQHNGLDLVDGASETFIFDDGTQPPREVGNGPRIGIRQAVEKPWRWWVSGSPYVSRARASRISPDPGMKAAPAQLSTSRRQNPAR